MSLGAARAVRIAVRLVLELFPPWNFGVASGAPRAYGHDDNHAQLLPA